MLESFVEQNKAITAANTECQPPAELHTNQWNQAEKVIKLLNRAVAPTPTSQAMAGLVFTSSCGTFLI